MRASRLVYRGLTYYWRTNIAVVLGVATAVAVLAGALLVGDSVRGSLRDLVVQRLVRAQKPSDMPLESLHGRKDDLGRTLRVTVRQVVPASQMGEFSIDARQGD